VTSVDFGANQAFFAQRFPAVAARVAQAAGQSTAVMAGDEARDIRFGDHNLYAGDARSFAVEQVASFMDKPLRVFMNRVDAGGLVSPICVRLVTALARHLLDDGQEALATYPTDNPTFLVVLGVGLGHHLEELARRTEARWLVIVEPMVGFFEHSFRVVNWPALVGAFEARGGTVHIVTDIDPAAMASGIVRFMDAQGIAYADGAWVFTHYPLWAFVEARKRLHEAIEFAFVNRGFFEDELKMMSNAVENFARSEFRLLEGRPRLARPEMAVVVGAGPSLDESLATLHRIRDRVVVFSCGTALRPLLRNGIVPDFQCELENIPEVHDVISDTAQFGDLKQITLVASATVDPRVPAYFGPKVFFFREIVSSTEILGRDFRPVPGAAPTCVNLGLAAAAFMGFVKFALFGTDCGVRSGGKVHAEGTVYHDLGAFQHRETLRTGQIEIDGNFGGVVTTDWVYDACRLMLASAIGGYRFDVVNCSDGALIPGARPCVPEALEIAGPAVDRAEFMTAMLGGMRRFAPGEILAARDLAALGDEVTELGRQLDGLMSELEAAEPDFGIAYRRLKSFVADIEDRCGHTESIISGTLNALPRIAMFYGFRISGGAARERLYRRYIAELRAIGHEMIERMRALMTDLARRCALGPAAAE
jgi:hypothetical protein